MLREPRGLASDLTKLRKMRCQNASFLVNNGYLFGMSALVIKGFPESLHARLKETAAAHRRSVTQETIHLLEMALAQEEAISLKPGETSYWKNRKLLPGYVAALRAGAFSGGSDFTTIVSDERNER